MACPKLLPALGQVYLQMTLIAKYHGSNAYSSVIPNKSTYYQYQAFRLPILAF
jgi:hypothetical protein